MTMMITSKLNMQAITTKHNTSNNGGQMILYMRNYNILQIYEVINLILIFQFVHIKFNHLIIE